MNAVAQKDSSHSKMHKSSAKNSFVEIFSKALTDSGLVNKKVRISELTMLPGHSDTISHRHGAEILIYVLEGSFEYRLGNNEPVLYTKGQVLHEAPYSLHTLTRNPSRTETAKLLLTFIHTDGAPLYIREYPEKK